MKIVEIDIDKKLSLKFNYNNKLYYLSVTLISKSNEYIVIPAILKNNRVVDPAKLKNAEIIYTIKDGRYRFPINKLQSEIFGGMRVYYAYSETDASIENRRESYRVFIGEIENIVVTNKDGKKKTVEGILKDLSLTGMGIVSKVDIEIGAKMKILYNFEGIDFRLMGEVVRKVKLQRFHAYSYGVKFESLNYDLNRILMIKQIRNRKVVRKPLGKTKEFKE